MKTSIILSTYNKPKSLRNALLSLSIQTHLPDEVVIADDGSAEETTSMIQGLQGSLPYPIHHVWHKDKGYRKSLILNRAVIRSTGDYLIFFDDDAIAFKNNIHVHIENSKPGRCICSGKINLTKSVTEKITDERILNGYFERPGFWWLSSGNVNRVFLRKFSSVSKFLDQKRPYRGRWSGENASLFREDFLKVGGFDERFTSYGLEDGEFGARLWNAGIRPANVVYRSPIIHQWHPQPYRNPAPDNRNLTLYRNTIDHGLQSTEYGIRQHRSQPGACG